MQSTVLDQEETVVLLPGLFMAILAAAGWASRRLLPYVRPFGTRESESLMHLSNTGTLQCHCEPTDALLPGNDRRRSCRACGCAIVSNDPARLYQQLTTEEIEVLGERLRRQGIDFSKSALRTVKVSFDETYARVGSR